MKYQSSSTHCSKVITCNKVKVSERRTEGQNDKNNMPPDPRSRGTGTCFINCFPYHYNVIISGMEKSKYLKYCRELNVNMFDTEKVGSLTCMEKNQVN